MDFIQRFFEGVCRFKHVTHWENLNYLRACRKGDAAKLISLVMIIDPIHESASNLLREKYENKCCIVQAHLYTKWTQANMKCESGLGLPKSLESTNEHSRALKVLGEPTDARDSLLAFWITEELEKESKKNNGDLLIQAGIF